jgi:hypothetical protein
VYDLSAAQRNGTEESSQKTDEVVAVCLGEKGGESRGLCVGSATHHLSHVNNENTKKRKRERE